MKLDFGETILWQGRPKRGLILSAKDAFIIPFSILWCGFITFWEYMALKMKAPVFMALFGIPFMLVGIYILIGRFIQDIIVRANTRYIVTSKRIAIKTFSKTRYIASEKWSAAQLEEFDSGYGNILFGEESESSGQRRNTSFIQPSNLGSPAFFRIPDAAKVYDLIRQIEI